MNYRYWSCVMSDGLVAWARIPMGSSMGSSQHFENGYVHVGAGMRSHCEHLVFCGLQVLVVAL
jgi:hypothetical protein